MTRGHWTVPKLPKLEPFSSVSMLGFVDRASFFVAGVVLLVILAVLSLGELSNAPTERDAPSVSNQRGYSCLPPGNRCFEFFDGVYYRESWIGDLDMVVDVYGSDAVDWDSVYP